jgi:serine/threonine-protein kinase HipA
MSRCLITYDELPAGEDHSARGLRLLSPRLEHLDPFPFTREQQLEEAARLAGRLSIQGVQPKLSAKLDVRHAGFAVVDRGGTFIIKPQSPLWPELPENEDLTMRMAAAAGVETPLHGLLRCADGSLSYLVRRFDRVGRGDKLAVEDFAQLSGSSRQTKYDSSMERVAGVVERFATFPVPEKLKLHARVLFSFLVGNEDMHLKNFSLITRDGLRQLSPAYDLLNSTIVLKGEAEELALPLRGKRRRLTRADLIDYYAGERLGLATAATDSVLARIAQALPRWDELLAASFLSAGAKERYAAVLAERRARLGL